MKLTKILIDKRGTLLKASLEKQGGIQEWEFYLRIQKRSQASGNSWTAEGTDEQSIKGVTIDAWHSLALVLIADGAGAMFPDAVRKIQEMVVDYEARQKQAIG